MSPEIIHYIVIQGCGYTFTMVILLFQFYFDKSTKNISALDAIESPNGRAHYKTISGCERVP